MEHQSNTDISHPSSFQQIDILFDLKNSSARIQQIIRDNQALKQQNQLQAKIIQNLQNQLTQAHLLGEVQQQKHRSLGQSHELKLRIMSETYQEAKYQHQIMICEAKKLKQKLSNCHEQNKQLRYQLAESSKFNQSKQYQIQTQLILIKSHQQQLKNHQELVDCLKIENQQLKSTNSKIIYENELIKMKLEYNQTKIVELEENLGKMVNDLKSWKQQCEQMSRKYNDLTETVELIDEMRRNVRKNKIIL